jgi:hypothetical protein
MLTRRRVIPALALALVLAIGWSVWLAVQTARDLRDAQTSVDRIQAAIKAQDSTARELAITELQNSAASAKDRTDGVWWSAMTLTPFVGDDASGVRSLSESLDLVAAQAIGPLGETVEDLDTIAADGRVDVEKVASLKSRVSEARDAFSSAADMVAAHDSSGYSGKFRTQYEEYVEMVTELARDLASAATAVQVIPSMLGGEGPRQYLLIFENNAEIRATGGLPGSWALVKTNEGRLELAKQGAATDFEQYAEPVGQVTTEEAQLFGREMGRFFQDPNFTPDFPRAAEVFNAFWSEKFPDETLDGVISIDVVGLSYLLDGLGPIEVAGLSLNSQNLVEQLLSKAYEEPNLKKQDETFQAVAEEVFQGATSGLADPLRFVEGMTRAAKESRFHVASFVPAESSALRGTRVAGELSGDAGTTPHVDFALNDATASKMSYYLRYSTEVRSLSCIGDVQQLGVTMTLAQNISPDLASLLPSYVTGQGPVGTRPGNQLVRVHVFAPFEGSITDVKINGRSVAMPEIVTYRTRPGITLAVLIDSLEDNIVTMRMESGPGQTSDGIAQETPSVVPGARISRFLNSC